MLPDGSFCLPAAKPEHNKRGTMILNKAFYKKLLEYLREGQKVVLETRYGGRQGAKADMQRRILPEEQCEGLALQSLKQGIPLTAREGELLVVAEPFFPEERLIVLGGGHIAMPLVEFAAKVGFSITVVDDRPAFANAQRFPLARQVLCEAFDRALKQLRITENDYIVIVTRGHRHDQVCLEQLLEGVEPFYTGMIGSRRRVGALKELLIEAGYDPARLSRIHTPIGLAIGAVTPEEIAVSILAELIACKRRVPEAGAEGARHISRSDVDFDVLRLLAEETEEPKTIVTVISSKGSVPRGAGAKMLVYPGGRIAGSIGGGCSEAAVISEARSIAGTGGYQLETVDLTGDVAESEGMVCGGTMQVMLEDYC